MDISKVFDFLRAAGSFLLEAVEKEKARANYNEERRARSMGDDELKSEYEKLNTYYEGNDFRVNARIEQERREIERRNL